MLLNTLCHTHLLTWGLRILHGGGMGFAIQNFQKNLTNYDLLYFIVWYFYTIFYSKLYLRKAI